MWWSFTTLFPCNQSKIPLLGHTPKSCFLWLCVEQFVCREHCKTEKQHSNTNLVWTIVCLVTVPLGSGHACQNSLHRHFFPGIIKVLNRIWFALISPQSSEIQILLFMRCQKQMFFLVHNGDTSLWRDRNVSKESSLSQGQEELHLLVHAVYLDLSCMF